MTRSFSGTRHSPPARSRKGVKMRAQTALSFDIDNPRHVSDICGSHDRHLAMIEQALNVYVVARGNSLTIEGQREDCQVAQTALQDLVQRLEQDLPVGEPEVSAAIRMAAARGRDGQEVSTTLKKHQIRTKKRVISPRSPAQAAYIEALNSHDLVFGLGPAGTGKTYLAVAVGVSLMLSGAIERLILSRPAVEAGERLGFLPGDMRDKIDPYLRPLYDALYDMLPGEQVAKKLEIGEIEVAPLAFMRGRTLSNAFVILDEAQNCTPMQIKMFLTRLGENSRMAVTGDPSQVDLSEAGTHVPLSGLTDALTILKGVEGVAMIPFTEADVVRHPLVARIVRAYDEKNNA